MLTRTDNAITFAANIYWFCNDISFSTQLEQTLDINEPEWWGIRPLMRMRVRAEEVLCGAKTWDTENDFSFTGVTGRLTYSVPAKGREGQVGGEPRQYSGDVSGAYNVPAKGLGTGRRRAICSVGSCPGETKADELLGRWRRPAGLDHRQQRSLVWLGWTRTTLAVTACRAHWGTART